MDRLIVLAGALALLAAPGAAIASGKPVELSPIEKKVQPCGACHGSDGVSIVDVWPNLAGQHRGYLVKQLKAFRSGTRKDPLMEPLAGPLSDTDIDEIAAYFAGLHDRRIAAPQATKESK